MPMMSFEEIREQDPETVIVNLLKSAKNSVWMSTRLNPIFFTKPVVKETLTETINKVTDFHILLDDDVNWEKRKEELPWLSKIIEEKGTVQIRQSEKPLLHWIIVDAKNIRLEKPHEDELMTSNLVIWDASKPIADMLQTSFNNWWSKAVPIE